jgi:ribosomal protein S18 acetylase RimI-like enzyme
MIQVRIIRPSEVDTAKSLIRSIFPRAMVQITEEDTVIVATEMGRMVGFAHLIDDGEKVILQGIGVDKSARGQGIGTLLLEHILAALGDLDKPIYLKVRVMNPAIDLYSRYGFVLKKYDERVFVLVKRPDT